VRRFLYWAAVLAAVGVTHYFATVWFCTSGAYADLILDGRPRWLLFGINYGVFFPLHLLAAVGAYPRSSIEAACAANSALWTVSVGAAAFGGRRLLTWWSAARRRKIHPSNP
jgi:hypothetical protein